MLPVPRVHVRVCHRQVGAVLELPRRNPEQPRQYKLRLLQLLRCGHVHGWLRRLVPGLQLGEHIQHCKREFHLLFVRPAGQWVLCDPSLHHHVQHWHGSLLLMRRQPDCALFL